MAITRCLKNRFKTESSSGEFGDHRLCGEKCCPLHSLFGVTPCVEDS